MLDPLWKPACTCRRCTVSARRSLALSLFRVIKSFSSRTLTGVDLDIIPSSVPSNPLPNIEDNLSRLSRSCFYSTLDGAGAYHVVPIKSKIGKRPHSGLPGVPTSLGRCPLGSATCQQLIASAFKWFYKESPIRWLCPTWTTLASTVEP
jgi:hypothetical protein